MCSSTHAPLRYSKSSSAATFSAISVVAPMCPPDAESLRLYRWSRARKMDFDGEVGGEAGDGVASQEVGVERGICATMMR